MKIRFYLHNTLMGGFTQMALWPAMYVTHNKLSRNTRLLSLSVNVLFWDFGFTIEWKKYE
jgi:hypothetical protein